MAHTLNKGIHHGTAATDTNLYRDSANVLKTDDKFVAVDGIEVGNSGYAISAGAGTIDISGANLYVTTNLSVDGNVNLGNDAGDLIGFYGATAVAQQAAPVTLADVITVLQTLGLTA